MELIIGLVLGLALFICFLISFLIGFKFGKKEKKELSPLTEEQKRKIEEYNKDFQTLMNYDLDIVYRGQR